VQKVVQMIGGDKAKLQAFCDIGKVQDQMQQADEKKDTKAPRSARPEGRRTVESNRTRLRQAAGRA
jgi:hypothetical protein